MKTAEESPEPHISRNRKTAPSKLRRGRKSCPLCLAPLGKTAARTRLRRECTSCRAHPSGGKRCVRCSAEAIWETKAAAACQSCGLHGRKAAVIARTASRGEEDRTGPFAAAQPEGDGEPSK